MKKTGLLLLISISFLCCAHAQTEKFKALYIYNFTKLIKFPESPDNSDFVIGVLGETPVNGELASIAATRKIENRNLVVRKITKPEDCNDCQIVFISDFKSSSIKAFSDYFERKPVLLISESPQGLEKGAAINFLLVDQKLKFELNRAKFDKNNLKVSSQLYELATNK